MDIQTKDGILLGGIPDGTPDDEIKARIAKIRAEQPTPTKESPGSTSLPSYGEMMQRGGLGLARGLIAGGPFGLATAGVQEGMRNATDIYNRAAYNVGGKVTDVTGSPKAGFAANVGVQALPVIAGALLGSSIGGKPVERSAEWLMQSATKPDMADRLSGAAARANRTQLAEGINPTRSGMDKAAQLVSQLHKKVEGAIAPSTAEVGIGPIGQKYLEQYTKALGQANPEADLAAVKGTWGEFVNSPLVSNQETIPVQLAHLLKKGTQSAVGSKAYGEMGTASTESQKALARYLRESVGEAHPEVLNDLAREASLMNVREVAMNRALAEANKNPLGLAALRMDNPLSAMTFMADKSAALKAYLARMLYQGKDVIPATTGAVVGADIGNRSGASQ